MSFVTSHMSISLDGFVAGPDQSQENPIGVGDNHPSAVYPNAGHGSFVLDESGNLVFFYTPTEIAEGKAPAFARMAAEGSVAEGLLSVWPSLTASAHATLWTGAPPRVHGVSGNQVPVLPQGDMAPCSFR